MSKNPALTPRNKNVRRAVKSNDDQLNLWLAIMAANEMPRNIEVPGIPPAAPLAKPWESLEQLLEWRALLKRVRRTKRKGDLPWKIVSEDFLREAVWGAYSMGVALGRIAQAQPGDIIDVGWLAMYPDSIRIEHDGKMKVMRDWTYEQILAELDGKDHDYIRKCPECGRLFRRKRKDQAVCGAGCRVRKSTDKNPEKKLELEAKRAQRDYLRDIEKRRNRLEETGPLKSSPALHKRSPRMVKSSKF